MDQAYFRRVDAINYTMVHDDGAQTGLEELEEALEAGADLILLDNFPLEALREAVRRVGGRVPLEASGNMTLERAKAAAEAGVDYVSVGALTHSAKALDLSLLVVRP